jgi:N-acetylglutamate synthase-like GNAT family acetyltransferase
MQWRKCLAKHTFPVPPIEPEFESSLYAPRPLSIFVTMTDKKFVTRRATVEDLPQLIALWRLEQLPAETLEKRFTEFHLVADTDGRVLAAIGIQLGGTQGLLHSESIGRAEISDALRGLLWERLQVIIKSNALERLWTQLDSHYWRDLGFQRATAEQLKMLPAKFSQGERPWRVKSLCAADANAVLERELAEIKTLQLREAARAQQRVQLMKKVALAVTVVVFLIVIAFTIALLKYGPQLFHRR